MPLQISPQPSTDLYIQKIDKLEKKKKYYKSMARTMKSDINELKRQPDVRYLQETLKQIQQQNDSLKAHIL